MTLNGMSSDPHNGVNKLDLILISGGFRGGSGVQSNPPWSSNYFIFMRNF